MGSRWDDLVEQVIGPKPAAPIAVPEGHGLFTGNEYRDTEGSQSFTVANGTALDQRLSFVAGSVIIDNNTSAWINIPDATKDGTGRYVQPGGGAAFPILGHISRARINWQAPPGKNQPAAIPTEQAQVIFLAAPAPPGFGFAAPTPALRWNINAAPATGSQATVVFAANPGVAHIGDSCAGTLVSAATSGTGGVAFRVKEGPNVITTLTYAVQAVAGAVTQCGPFGPGLALRGGLGDSMTVEFGSGLTNVAQSVNLNGYDQ